MLLLVMACTSEIDQVSNGSRENAFTPKTVFQASTEGPSSPKTKVYADENMKVLWNADDRISIYNFTTYNYQYVFTGDDGDTAGDFELIPASGFITGQNVDYAYAAYPYSKSNKLSNSGVFTMVLPAEQFYKEKSFGMGANTMVAITDGSFLAFKNVGGYLSLRLYGDNISVSRITIKGNNGEKIAGKASIDIPFGGTPTVTMDATATNEVSVICDPAVKIGEDANNYTDFWFVIPPVTFEKGFTITVTDDMGGVFEKSTSKSFTVTRNTLDWMSALQVNPEVSFEDLSFKAYCLEHFDTNHDGVISSSEAASVETIDIISDDIVSLKGVEYFCNLKYLRCEGTGYRTGKLSYLDITHCPELEQLIVLNNNLERLDVSKCPKLFNIHPAYNLLPEIDLSNNPSLTHLGINHNLLTEIDLSACPLLEGIDVSNNQLTSLDLSVLTGLIWLEANFCNLTELSVTNLTELVELRASGNNLGSIDLSHNGKLTQLELNNCGLTTLDLSGNPLLEYCVLEDNQLSQIDLSKLPNLSNFQAANNPLTDIDFSHNPLLKHIGLNLTEMDHIPEMPSYGMEHIHICGIASHMSGDFLRSFPDLITFNIGCFQGSQVDLSQNTKMDGIWCESAPNLEELDLTATTASTIGLRVRWCPKLTKVYVRSGTTFGELLMDDHTEIVYVD